MQTIIQTIKKAFEKEIFDDNSKKRIKELGILLKPDDINFLIKTSFDFFRQNLKTGNPVFLTDCLEGVCNTLNSLRHCPETVSDVYFAPNDDCSGKLIEFINSAKEMLLICVFTISDNSISESIIKQHRKGVKVKIITDNEKQYDKGSDIRELTRAGIEVKSDTDYHHMHHKFAIVDNKSLLTGSFNWTRSASEFNQENIIIVSDDFAIKRYMGEFNRLWKISVRLNED